MQLKVLTRLIMLCESEAAVRALWLEGSWADDRHDELSDIDVWLDVAEEDQERVWGLVISTLREFGEIDAGLMLGSGLPGVTVRTLHLAASSEFETYDFNMLTHGRRRAFVRGIHTVKTLVDKDSVIEWHEPEPAKIAEMMDRRAQELRAFFNAGVPLIRKQILRGNYMEAYLHYGHWCLTPLIDLARIKYAPYKLDNFIKHIYDDLPAVVTKRLEPLFRVSSLEDISQHLAEAQEIMRELS